MKKDWEIYRDTGMLGAYETENAVLRQCKDGGVETIFRDSSIWNKDTGIIREREMLIGDRRYCITSVFPVEGTATPTDKLLDYIDTDMKKGTQSA